MKHFSSSIAFQQGSMDGVLLFLKVDNFRWQNSCSPPCLFFISLCLLVPVHVLDAIIATGLRAIQAEPGTETQNRNGLRAFCVRKRRMVDPQSAPARLSLLLLEFSPLLPHLCIHLSFEYIPHTRALARSETSLPCTVRVLRSGHFFFCIIVESKSMCPI